MPKLIVLFNHTLTAAQEADARAGLGVEDIVEPPDDIKKAWANVPPEPDDISGWLAPVRKWLLAVARSGDFVLVQGEFGATFQMVGFCFARGLTPVYSTTRREAREEHLPGGAVEVRHLFSHVRFRMYAPS